MPFAAALSTAPDPSRAAAEVCERVRADLSGPPDLALAFFSAHHLRAADVLCQGMHKLRPRCLLGCVAEAVVGNEREVEEGPALSLWAARWAHPVTMEPFHLVPERTPDGPSLLGWADALTGADAAQAAVLLLADPYTFPVELFFKQLHEASPGLRVLGGMASGIGAAGECRLLLGEGRPPGPPMPGPPFAIRIWDQGAVGVLLQGEIGLRSIVSQGCRPVGRPLVVTKAAQNVILELGGKPPLARLRELWETLGPEEQQLFRHGLHVGRVISEYGGDFQRGDFLVRNVLNIDRDSGAMVITDRVRVGQTLQFHVRDAATADEDLHALLQLDLSAHERRPGGALLFTCNGRGTRLFDGPDHDARALRAEAGPIPVAGFFAQGELGPVGGQNFIHGYTASVALFEE